jgi:hypothetical protein
MKKSITVTCPSGDRVLSQHVIDTFLLPAHICFQLVVYLLPCIGCVCVNAGKKQIYLSTFLRGQAHRTCVSMSKTFAVR